MARRRTRASRANVRKRAKPAPWTTWPRRHTCCILSCFKLFLFGLDWRLANKYQNIITNLVVVCKQVLDQWCCRSVGYTNYGSGTTYYNEFAVIENNSCGDRTSWPCRVENAGPTCCPTSVAGCKQAKYWEQPWAIVDDVHRDDASKPNMINVLQS